MSRSSETSGMQESRTSIEALRSLATHVTDLLGDDSIDPRFARKLARRIVDEARCIEESDASRSIAFQSAMARLAASIDGRQANELVAAVVALRAAEHVASGS